MDHYFHHHRKRKKMGYAKRKILIFILPGIFLLPVIIGMAVAYWPKPAFDVFKNIKHETNLSNKYSSGSAVLKETYNHEEQFRKKYKDE